jgi:hypothetical protein
MVKYEGGMPMLKLTHNCLEGFFCLWASFFMLISFDPDLSFFLERQNMVMVRSLESDLNSDPKSVTYELR